MGDFEPARERRAESTVATRTLSEHGGKDAGRDGEEDAARDSFTGEMGVCGVLVRGRGFHTVTKVSNSWLNNSCSVIWIVLP
jgi:hypothetical protein